MYCSSCRQERLGGLRCAACGKPMVSRPREVLEQELAHVHFLLEELKDWDPEYVPKAARGYLTQRYSRQVRILRSVLAETPAEAVASAETVAPAEAVAPVEAVAPAEVVSTPPATVATATEETPEARYPHPDPLPEEEGEEAEEPVSLPPVSTEPLFDAPAPRSVSARLVEEVSTWDTVWRPFLYESIGWFIGASMPASAAGPS